MDQSLKRQLLKKEILKKALRAEWTEENGTCMGFHCIRKGNLTIRLADIWGFCYGVLYAIEAITRTLEEHRGRKIYVLGDLIHNPHVNDELQKLGAIFIDPDDAGNVEDGSVVVVPAFGSRRDVLEPIQRRNIDIVNTTCSEVKRVEEEVSRFGQEKYTAVIHGNPTHPETIATGSFAEHFMIIRNRIEAEAVCSFIRGDTTKEKIIEQFIRSVSTGFDPTVHLTRIGLANQTTMLMNETMEIFELFRHAVRQRDGHEQNIRILRTICSATQDRQDAVARLAKNGDITFFIDVGGHSSSNTRNLAITAFQNSGKPVYHIESADSFTRDTILHLPINSSEPVTRTGWLTPGAVTIGVTAGASTPHSEMELVLEKILSFF